MATCPMVGSLSEIEGLEKYSSKIANYMQNRISVTIHLTSVMEKKKK